MAWPKPDQVTTRMIDLGHAHPAQPPASEASSDITGTAKPKLTQQNGIFQLGLDEPIAPAPAPPFPFQDFDVSKTSATPQAVIVPPPPTPVTASGGRPPLCSISLPGR